MPQIVAFTIKDGSAVPADVTYGLDNIQDGDIMLADKRLSTRGFWPTIKSVLSLPNKQRPNYYRVTREMTYPLVRTTNGVDAVVAVNREVRSLFISDKSTAQEIKHMIALGQNQGAHAMMKTQAENLEKFFS